MFVRWKRARRKDSRHTEVVPGRSYNPPISKPEWLLSAVLVESVRIGGKPRQRIIAYLGSIRESRLDPACEYGIFHRGYFWRDATARLEALDIHESERARISAALAERVPPPDPEEHAQARADVEHREAQLRNRLGLM